MNIEKENAIVMLYLLDVHVVMISIHMGHEYKLVQSGYFTKVCVKDANLSLGVCMYKRNAELFHLPRALMVESSRPACAAAVVAPIRKLCPAY